jgi:hypothetical protein
MRDKPKVIRFTATVNKVQTMVDGGGRVVLDFDEGSLGTFTSLVQAKHVSGLLEIAAVVIIPSLTNGKKRTDSGATRSPIDVAGG